MLRPITGCGPLQLVGDLPFGAEIEHAALGYARAGVARCAQIGVDDGAGRAADADRARERGLHRPEVDRAIGAVERAEIDGFEIGVVHRVDDRRRCCARNLDAVALLAALLVVQRRVEIEFEVVVGLPLERGGAVVGFIFVILESLLQELDAQERKGLGARTRARKHQRVAIDTRLERGDVLPRIAAAQHDADLADAGIPPVAERRRYARQRRFRQVAIFHLRARSDQRFLEVERADRPQIDRAADRPFDRLRGRNLRHFDRGDQRGGQILETDARAAGARSDGGNAVDFGAVGVGAADLHGVADTRLPGDLNAGDIFEHFGEVLVGQLADILGLDDFDDIVGGALFAQRGGKGAANARYDDRIIACLIGGCRAILPGRVLRKGGAAKHRECSGAEQRRRKVNFACARCANDAAPNHPTLPI